MKTFCTTALILCLTAIPALSQASCKEYRGVVKFLKEKYGENAVTVGIMANGKMMQIYSNEESGTWTAVVTSPETGIACLMASGGSYEAINSDPKS